MCISLSVLVLIMVSSQVLCQEGNFGILTACRHKNNSLRLECSYAYCRDSPSYDCEYTSSQGEFWPSSDQCNLTIPDHKLLYGNKTTNYTCKLTRKKRTENKTIVINYLTKIRKQMILECPGATGLLLHHTPASPSTLVALSLCMVFITGRHTE